MPQETTLTRASTTLTLPHPQLAGLVQAPGKGAIVQQGWTGKVFSISITGGNDPALATFTRSYVVDRDQYNEAITFLNDTCEGWSQPFTMRDPVFDPDNDLADVYADLSTYTGVRPYNNFQWLLSLNFIKST